MAEVYTPTTAEIRSGYAREDAIPPGIVRRLWAQFDRWLAEHDREVRAEAQREVLRWLHERGVQAEQLDMALERFVEPHGLTLDWASIPVSDDARLLDLGPACPHSPECDGLECNPQR